MTLPALPPADPTPAAPTSEPQELLLVRCSPSLGARVEPWLRDLTWSVRQSFSLDHALDQIRQRPPSVLLVEPSPAVQPDSDLHGWLEGVCSILPVILMMPDMGPVHAAQLRRLGVFELITPQDLELGALSGLLAAAPGRFASARIGPIHAQASGEAADHARHVQVMLVVRRLQAERASQAKSRFLAGIGHDLRQPLHALSLFVEDLRRLCTEPCAQAVMNHMSASLQSMGALLDSVQVVSRLDTEPLVPALMALPIGPMLARLRATHQGAALAKGLRLAVVDCRAEVMSDPGLLERILNNLVANAVQYTDRGGVLVACRRRGDRLLIQVWDTGVGIAPEEQEAVFREFYQVAAQGPSAGSGLGLSIVRRCADALGLRIGLRSEPGRGSCFFFELPCASMTDHGAGGVPLVQDQPGWQPAGPLGLTLMLIGADHACRMALAPLLERWGCRVLQASTLREAQIAASRASGGLQALIGVLSPGAEALVWSAVRSVRSARDAKLPAILITTDTSLHATRLARRQEVMLVNRPVLPVRLYGLLAWLGNGAGDQPARS